VWPINPSDLNLGTVSGGSDCVGGVFDVTLGAAIPSGAPSWIIGEAFLVRAYHPRVSYPDIDDVAFWPR
jgi:cathepsin D